MVDELQARGIGFRSLTENIDTTTPGGRPIFHVFFGALGQFERDLIQERTKAGLAAAAARGRKGGRKPVVTEEKLQRARAHLANGLTVREVATRLKMGKTTLYEALKTAHPEPHEADSAETTATIRLALRIENNNKSVRGRKCARENVERYCFEAYDAKPLANGEYELKMPYSSDKDLDKRMHDLLCGIASEADDRNCFSESEACMIGTDRHWSDSRRADIFVPVFGRQLTGNQR